MTSTRSSRPRSPWRGGCSPTRELRPFARDARPTVRDLSALVRSPGEDNDLLELQRTYPPLADIALNTKTRSIDFGTGERNVGETRGAFPELASALAGSTPIVAHGRPYTPTSSAGWTTSPHGRLRERVVLAHADAAQRVQPVRRSGAVAGLLPLVDRADVLKTLTRVQQVKRCPGASEEAAPDGSNVWSLEEQRELDCLEKDRDGAYTP